ncbi:hypothetical protein ACFLY6_00440 [Candidatus Dependentiae bacterium]
MFKLWSLLFLLLTVRLAPSSEVTSYTSVAFKLSGYVDSLENDKRIKYFPKHSRDRQKLINFMRYLEKIIDSRLRPIDDDICSVWNFLNAIKVKVIINVEVKDGCFKEKIKGYFPNIVCELKDSFVDYKNARRAYDYVTKFMSQSLLHLKQLCAEKVEMGYTLSEFLPLGIRGTGITKPKGLKFSYRTVTPWLPTIPENKPFEDDRWPEAWDTCCFLDEGKKVFESATTGR